MDRASVLKLCAQQFGTAPDYPFTDDHETAVLRHADTRKWYAIIMHVPCKVLGIAGDSRVDILNVKIDPRIRGSMLLEKGIYPAYHMSKSCWVSVLLDGSVNEDTVFFLLQESYHLTAKKKK